MNYKKPAFWILLIAVILCVAVAVDFLSGPVTKPDETKAEFVGTVVESSLTWITVEPDPGTAERNCSDRITVSLYTHFSEGNLAGTGIIGEFHVGDRVRIVYDGLIQETYPARISNVYSIETLESSEPALYNVIQRADQNN